MESTIQDKRDKVNSFFAELDFNAKQHQYRYKGRQLSSVSSYIKKYVEEFDASTIAGYVAKSRGISKEKVLQEWEDIKNTACDKGNRVHDYGETYSNNIIDGKNHSKSPSDPYEEAVVSFWNSLPSHIVPFINELKMFSEWFGVAGTGDIILYNTITGKFIIGDYKTNKDIFKNHKGKKMYTPYNDMLDMPYSKYEIQLSFYQYLFEQTGFKVERRALIWLLPDGTFKVYETRDLRETIKNTFN